MLYLQVCLKSFARPLYAQTYFLNYLYELVNKVRTLSWQDVVNPASASLRHYPGRSALASHALNGYRFQPHDVTVN